MLRLLVVATLHQIAANRVAPAGLLCGLSSLARPEGLLLAIVLLVSMWRRRDRTTRPDALGGITLLLAVVGTWAVFAICTFGSVVPQSIVVKAVTTHGAGLRTELVIGASCAILILGQVAAGWLVKLPNDRTFWVEGYVRVAALIPHDERVRVAACEIGALGWTVWPTQVIDLVGIVTPQAIGTPGDVILRITRPEYVVLRTDSTSCFLSRVEKGAPFARDYTLVASIDDPYVAREFRAYKLNAPAYGSGSGGMSEPLTATTLGLILFREHLGAIGIGAFLLLLLIGLARLRGARQS